MQNTVLEPIPLEAELERAAQHSLRLDSAHRAAFDAQRLTLAVDEVGADRRDRNQLPFRHVGRRSRDRQGRFAGDVHRAELQAVGIGMTARLDDPSGDDAAQLRTPLDRLDGKPHERDLLRDRIARAIEFDVVAQPADRRLHTSDPNTAGSFSVKTRMSSTP